MSLTANLGGVLSAILSVRSAVRPLSAYRLPIIIGVPFCGKLYEDDEGGREGRMGIFTLTVIMNVGERCSVITSAPLSEKSINTPKINDKVMIRNAKTHMVCTSTRTHDQCLPLFQIDPQTHAYSKELSSP